MPITGMDSLVAGFPGTVRPIVKLALTGTFPTQGAVSLWTAAGYPSAGVSPNSLTGAAPTSATAGAIPFSNPTSPTLSYIGRAALAASVNGYFVLYDRLSHSSNMAPTTITAQTVTSAAIPRGDTTGLGVELWMENYTATGAVTTTLTCSYTNQAGTAGRSSAITIPASMPVGYMQQVPWVSGDTGVRSIQTATLTASITTGSIGFTLVRRLTEIPISVAGLAQWMDAVQLGIPQVNDSACIAAMFNPASSAAPATGGSISIIQV